jgi:hypothetical protein
MSNPAFGFTPATIALTGRLTGIDPADANFCHAAVTWIRIGPGHSEESASKIAVDPVCRHPEEETHVTTSFTKRFTLVRPGSHLFRLMVEGKDGTRIRSGYTKVRVLRVR